MYDVKSERAEEFISDAEIRETMAYAEAHKDDRPLIVSILEKARLCKGLTHREAAVLLASGQQDLTEEMFALARDIKQRFYGNRIVMFAPLYLSNYCVNGCVYCPYHAKNKMIRRRKLTQEEIRREVIALQDMGHKRLALETGEDPRNNPIEYVLESIRTIYSIKHKNGAIRRIFFFRRRITGRIMRHSILRGRRATMPITPRPWTVPCWEALMTWVSACCSGWRLTVTTSSAC